MHDVNSNSLERKSRIQSAVVTLVIQLLLFLAFYFMIVWEQPNPPTPTYGLELNLGFSDFGSGDPSEVLANSSEIPVTEAPAPGEIVPPTQTPVATSNATASKPKPSTSQAVSTQPSPIRGEAVATPTPVKEEAKEVPSNQRWPNSPSWTSVQFLVLEVNQVGELIPMRRLDKETQIPLVIKENRQEL